MFCAIISSHQHWFAGRAVARNATPVCCFLVDLPWRPVAPCSPAGGPGRQPRRRPLDASPPRGRRRDIRTKFELDNQSGEGRPALPSTVAFAVSGAITVPGGGVPSTEVSAVLVISQVGQRAVTRCPGPKAYHHGPDRVPRQPLAPLVAPLVPVLDVGSAAHALHPSVRENEGGHRPHHSSASSSCSARAAPPPDCACLTVAPTAAVRPARLSLTHRQNRRRCGPGTAPRDAPRRWVIGC